jgi:regulatory protein
MPTVTDITRQKNNRDIFNIYVDGKFICGLSSLELSVCNLRIGQKITPKIICDIQKTSANSKAYNMSLRYLSFRPRSVYEMRQYLIRKKVDGKQIDNTIEKLVQNDLLNDEKFCDSWVNSRDLVKPTSKKVLFLELVSKGVDKAIIEKTLNNREEGIEIENIKHLAQKKISYNTDQRKIIDFLLRRGYRFSDIKEALSQLSASSD